MRQVAARSYKISGVAWQPSVIFLADCHLDKGRTLVCFVSKCIVRLHLWGCICKFEFGFFWLCGFFCFFFFFLSTIFCRFPSSLCVGLGQVSWNLQHYVVCVVGTSECVFMCGTVNLCSLLTDGGHSGSTLGGKGTQSSQVSWLWQKCTSKGKKQKKAILLFSKWSHYVCFPSVPYIFKNCSLEIAQSKVGIRKVKNECSNKRF